MEAWEARNAEYVERQGLFRTKQKRHHSDDVSISIIPSVAKSRNFRTPSLSQSSSHRCGFPSNSRNVTMVVVQAFFGRMTQRYLCWGETSVQRKRSYGSPSRLASIAVARSCLFTLFRCVLMGFFAPISGNVLTVCEPRACRW